MKKPGTETIVSSLDMRYALSPRSEAGIIHKLLKVNAKMLDRYPKLHGKYGCWYYDRSPEDCPELWDFLDSVLHELFPDLSIGHLTAASELREALRPDSAADQSLTLSGHLQTPPRTATSSSVSKPYT